MLSFKDAQKLYLIRITLSCILTYELGDLETDLQHTYNKMNQTLILDIQTKQT